MTMPKSTVAVRAPGRRLARASTQKKLDELLMRAASLIARKGFEATSMRDLGKAMDASLAGPVDFARLPLAAAAGWVLFREYSDLWCCSRDHS